MSRKRIYPQLRNPCDPSIAHVLEEGMVAVWKVDADLNPAKNMSALLYKPKILHNEGDILYYPKGATFLPIGAKPLLTEQIVFNDTLQVSILEQEENYGTFSKLPARYRAVIVIRQLISAGIAMVYIRNNESYIKLPMTVKEFAICCRVTRDTYYSLSRIFGFRRIYPKDIEGGLIIFPYEKYKKYYTQYHARYLSGA